MRRFLLLTFLLAGAGCQGLRPCDDPCASVCRKRSHLKCLTDCEPRQSCEVEAKKPVGTPPPKKDEPKTPAGAPRPDLLEPVGRAPAIAQDVLLVPKTVYIPYAAQTPTMPVRLGIPAGGPVGNPVGNPQPDQPVTTPPPKKEVVEVPCETTRQMLEMCRKINDRLDCLERKHKETIICVPPAPSFPPTMVPCPPTMVPCPPPPSLFPLLRRTLFPRCEPSTQCEPATPCPTPAPPQ